MPSTTRSRMEKSGTELEHYLRVDQEGVGGPATFRPSAHRLDPPGLPSSTPSSCKERRRRRARGEPAWSTRGVRGPNMAAPRVRRPDHAQIVHIHSRVRCRIHRPSSTETHDNRFSAPTCLSSPSRYATSSPSVSSSWPQQQSCWRARPADVAHPPPSRRGRTPPLRVREQATKLG